MFAKSHVFLAGKIASGLYVDIPLKPFLFGSVYPDFSIQYKSIDHNIEGALPKMQELIDLVKAAEPSAGVNNRQAFQMGIISHFLCDFFCQAHNFKEFDFLLNHFRYEIQMEYFIQSVLKQPEKLNFHSDDQLTARQKNSQSIIEDTHDLYLHEPRSLITDLKFAVACSTQVLNSSLNSDVDLRSVA